MNSFVTKPKLFHSYNRNKEVGHPTTGPFKNDFGDVYSSNKEMAEQFTNVFFISISFGYDSCC